jgi:C4-dicarboxylate-specific signal transduction histidine kinase
VEQALGAYATGETVKITRNLTEQPDVLVDPEQVQGALGNVVRNAVEAVSAGGASGSLSVGTHREDDMLVIRIADSGPGVAAEIRAHLFEPLFTTKTSGLGLGLVTARALVENQGGRLELVATKGPGATFDVFLPIAT